MRALLAFVGDRYARAVYRLARLLGSDSLWTYLDRTGIVIFTGPNGSGKSLAAVASLLPVLQGDGVRWECWNADHRHHDRFRFHYATCQVCPAPGAVERARARAIKQGTPVLDLFCAEGYSALAEASTGTRLAYSTVTLLDPETGEPHDRFRPLTDFRALILIEHADCLFDEVAGIADAQDSGSIPVQVVQWMHTLRKSDVRLRVTTPAYSRCAKPVRQVAQAVVDCRSHFPERVGEGRLWRSRRMFTFRAYDRAGFEDFTEGVKDRVSASARSVFWRPGCAAELHYDTLSAVAMLGHVTEHGMCSACGGTRSRPRCACDPSADHEHFTIEEVVSGAGSRVRRAVPVESSTPGAVTAADVAS